MGVKVMVRVGERVRVVGAGVGDAGGMLVGVDGDGDVGGGSRRLGMRRCVCGGGACAV